MYYHIFIFFTLLISSLVPVDAFFPGSPSFIEKSLAYQVSKVNRAPADFVSKEQLYLKGLKGLLSKNTASSSGGNDIVTISDGIFLLDTDSSFDAFYLNVSFSDNTFPLLIDTASPYLWVYGENCTSDACSNQKLYTPTSTSTASQTFALDYSEGTASGIISEVEVTFNDQLSIPSFNVGVAETAPSIFEGYNISGVVGLPSNANTTLSGLQNLVLYLYKAGSLDSDLFSIILNNGTSNYNGLLSIGKLVDELYTGDISYTDVISNDQNYWKIGIDNVYIDDYQVTFNREQTIDEKLTNTSRLAIVDTGTTIMLLNKKDASKLHSFFTNSVSDGTNYAIYCNETKIIDLEIGGLNFSIDSSSYLGQKYPTSSKYSGYCVSNFQGSDLDDQGSWILGALFLKRVYSVFDLQQGKFGVANRNFNDISFTTASTTEMVSTNSKQKEITTRVSSSLSSSTTTVSTTSSSNSQPKSSSSLSISSNSSNSSNSTTDHSANFAAVQKPTLIGILVLLLNLLLIC